jgi:hypothetical protein
MHCCLEASISVTSTDAALTSVQVANSPQSTQWDHPSVKNNFAAILANCTRRWMDLWKQHTKKYSACYTKHTTGPPQTTHTRTHTHQRLQPPSNRWVTNTRSTVHLVDCRTVPLPAYSTLSSAPMPSHCKLEQPQNKSAPNCRCAHLSGHRGDLSAEHRTHHRHPGPIERDSARSSPALKAAASPAHELMRTTSHALR